MSTRGRNTALAALVAAFLTAAAVLVAAPPSEAQSAHRQQQIEAARNYFTDVELTNQFGKPVRLYSDLIQDKVVVINSMYTNCADMCPLLGKALEEIQKAAGDRMGKDVYILSFTVDPANDTPEKLRKWGESFHAGPGWFFLTGDKDDLDFALKRVGQFTADPENHQGILIMGNDRTGLWKKAFGLASPQDLIKVFDSVANDTGEDAAGSGAASGAHTGRSSGGGS